MSSAESLLSTLGRRGLPDARRAASDATFRVRFDFDQGLAAPETFPIDTLKQLAADVLDRDGGRALEYRNKGFDPETGDTIYLSNRSENMFGNGSLREELARWVGSTQGAAGLTAEHFMLTCGSVQAIALAMTAFVDPGDGVLVERLSFPYAIQYARMRGAEIGYVELDRQGLVPDSLERQLQSMAADNVRPKLLYTIPTFQLPTGAVVPEARRARILELARQWDIVVVEDAVYSDLRYEGAPVPSLLAMEESDRVLQSHSFSKNVAPALRIGWMCASPGVLNGLASVRQDLGVSQWISRMMADYLRADQLDPHIAAANLVYRERRDIAAAGLSAVCGDAIEFEMPEGGFYLWVRVRDSIDWAAAQQTAASSGVFFRHGRAFAEQDDSGANPSTEDDSVDNWFRLAFSHIPRDRLEQGVQVLGESIIGARRAPQEAAL